MHSCIDRGRAFGDLPLGATLECHEHLNFVGHLQLNVVHLEFEEILLGAVA